MTMPLSQDPTRLACCIRELIDATAELARQGFTPATSSNFSMRLDASHAVLTASGRDKGRLTESDFLVVNLAGEPVGSPLRPSAETLLHTQIYQRFPDVGCVLHTHSHTQTVASRLFAEQGQIRLEGYELLKAFPGNTTHEMVITVPVLRNSQDMPHLASCVAPLLEAGPLWGYLIEGHGLYAWGATMADARRHLDAFEFLLTCELDLRRLRA